MRFRSGRTDRVTDRGSMRKRRSGAMSKRMRHRTAAALILLAAVLIAAGVLRGDPSAVMNKAIFICLECIGVG